MSNFVIKTALGITCQNILKEKKHPFPPPPLIVL